MTIVDATQTFHNFLINCRQQNRVLALEALYQLNQELFDGGELPSVFRHWDVPQEAEPVNRLHVFVVPQTMTDSRYPQRGEA